MLPSCLDFLLENQYLYSVEATGYASGFFMTKLKFYIDVNTQDIRGTDMSMLFARVTKGERWQWWL